MTFGITNKLLAAIEGNDTTKVSLQFEGPEFVTIGSPEIEWKLLNGSDALVDLVQQKDGSQVKRAAEGAAEHTIKDLDGSSSYEVRVRAYVTAISSLQIEMDFYGEYSDTLTVTLP